MQNDTTIVCPVCNDAVDKLLYRFHFESEKVILQKIKEQYPQWTEEDGICSRCVDHYNVEIVMKQHILPEVGPYFPVKSPDDYIILPTALRLNADPRYTGKGVTICFIDSGFYLHPDLTAQNNRIKKLIDITDPELQEAYFLTAHSESWHGTMTSVVCAGDGYLSKGLYRGIANDAELVLLKVMDDKGKITTENISKALQWVLRNHLTYNIKILNMSIGDDEAIPYKNSVIDELAEHLTAQGVTVVAAVGNDETASIKPPANSPHVIAVGGIDDDNTINDEQSHAYHSSFGATIDGIMKPELVANAIWIAAPILPGTVEKEKAELLHELLKTDEASLKNVHNDVLKKAGIHCGESGILELKNVITGQIQATKFFSPHYMHVDGTSFAAPIVCAVIAQLLEANPLLTPKQIRQVLFSSAKMLPGIETIRQGFGYIQPRKALLKILNKEFYMKQHESPYINKRKKIIEFHLHNTCAAQISLAGTFNHWAQDVLLMEPCKDGLWKIEIPLLPKGTYKYKFFIDDKMWMEDVENPLREHDGFNGWNSLLEVN